MRSPSRRISATALASLLWLGAGLQEGSDDAQPPPIVFSPPRALDGALERVAVDDLACAACHVAIADEWSRSLHAYAFEDPVYQKEIRRKRRRASCLGCHVPVPLHAPAEGATPRARPAPREDTSEDPHRFGVSCSSCHLGAQGKILGPFGAPTDAHVSERHPSFVGTGSNALCLACHSTTIGPVIGIGKDFEQAGRSERCIDCHMQPLERPLATSPASEAGGPSPPARAGRSHFLQGPRDPAFLAQAFVVEEVRHADGELLVRIGNRAGHRVPGLTLRTLELRLEGGEEGPASRRRIDHEAWLPVGGSFVLRTRGTDRARLVGHHTAPGAPAPVRFLDLELR